MAKDYLTEEKFKELTKELAYLKSEGRTEVASRLEYAKSLGDLKENSEYHEAKESLANLEERIAILSNLLKDVEIVKQHHSIRVEIGSKVLIAKAKGGEPKWYMVVGSAEADAMQSKISNESPMGSAMLGKKKGDSFVVKTPKGETKYTIEGME